MSDDELPLGWTSAPIGEVGEVRLGRQRSPSNHNGPNMRPYLRVANVHEDRIDYSDVMSMNFKPNEFEIFRLRDCDILLNEGQSLEFVGRPAMFRGERDDMCFTNSLIRFRAGAGVDPAYALALFRSYMRDGTFTAAAKITTNIAHLGGDRFANLPFRVAPLGEQRRIVAKLDALLARSKKAREHLDRIPKLLDALKRSILAAAFRGDLTADWRAAHPDVEPASALLERIRAERRRRWENEQRAKGKDPKKAKYDEPEPVDASKLPELPPTWCWASLPSLGLLSRGRSQHRPRNDPRLFGDRVPFLQTGDVARANGRIESWETAYSEFGVAQSRVFPAGTVCITIAANIAASGVLAFDACFPDSVVGLVVESRLVTPEYVEFFIRTARDDLAAFAPATAQANINLEVLSGVVVPLAPRAEVDEIGSRVRRMLASTMMAESQRSQAENVLKSVEAATLAAAFRGELVEQDPNDEPASVMLERIRKAREAEAPEAKRGRKKAT